MRKREKNPLKKFNKMTTTGFALLFLISAIVTGTLAWENIGQSAKNEAVADNTVIDVELVKLEKDVNGNETETPVPGAEFTLFKEDGTQIGSTYTTDDEGKIAVSLKPGEYYFKELFPALNYTFDKDKNGNEISEYPFTVTGLEEETVVVTAYNQRLKGSLDIEKQVTGNPPNQDEEFEFTVIFSDGGTYSYSVDGEAAIKLKSGDTLKLRNGQKAEFENLPVGMEYTVTETPKAKYVTTSTGHHGNITEEGSVASFVNKYDPDAITTGALTVSKEIRDLSDDKSADLNKEFEFTVEFSDGKSYKYSVDGGPLQSLTSKNTLKLKHGQNAVFTDVPSGVKYTVTEASYSSDGYTPVSDSYSGTIIGAQNSELLFENLYGYPDSDKDGSLTIEKEITDANPDKNAVFEFTVTFSDDGTYSYSIDGGPLEELASGETLKLKHGQKAVFKNLPAGIKYTVEESKTAVDTSANAVLWYTPVIDKAEGIILGEQDSLVTFRNAQPENPVEIRVTKKLDGDYPAEDAQKEFEFTMDVDGREYSFTLKNGQTKTFKVAAGSKYSVVEKDYSSEGYVQTITNGSGTAAGGVIDVTQINSFGGRTQLYIDGTKTWNLSGYSKDVLPESITVQLKNGDTLIEEVVVTPDDNGEWKYSFTVPEYDADGKKIDYHIEEIPIVSFEPEYDGYDIENTYIPPVTIDPPVVKKIVEGENIPETQFQFIMTGQDDAPMPEGSNGSTKVITLTGAGEAEFGDITYIKPGTYIYVINEGNEVKDGQKGWIYDEASYILTVEVTLENGKLVARKTLEKNDVDVTDEYIAEFINTYDETARETVLIEGQKTWYHGNNPKENQPSSIIVRVYGNGKQYAERQVTEKDGWKYSFELPKYDSDTKEEIIYSIGEAKVPNYQMRIEGYDLVNLYSPGEEEYDPNKPGGSGKPGSTKPKTGDDSHPVLWLLMMEMSLLGFLVCTLVVMKNRKAYSRHSKRRE